jgi:hypothetical protein
MARKLTENQTRIIRGITKLISDRTDLVIDITDVLNACMNEESIKVLSKNVISSRQKKEKDTKETIAQ